MYTNKQWIFSFPVGAYSYQFPGNPVPSKDQYDSVIPVTRETWQRVIDFQRTHPNVDIRPYISERVNDLLDDVERAENG